MLVAAALGVVLAPSSARAQDAQVKGLRIVVPDAIGKGPDGRAALTKALRRTMAEGVGPLIPSQKLADAQRKLKLKGKELTSPAGLAAAARAIDAQYVLTIEVTKEKWTYTARALLVNAENAEIQMDFRSQYFKPNKEADDRGKRIGARTLLKLEELLKAGPAPFTASPGAVAAADPSKGDKLGDRAGDKLGDKASRDRALGDRAQGERAIGDRAQPTGSGDRVDDRSRDRAGGEDALASKGAGRRETVGDDRVGEAGYDDRASGGASSGGYASRDDRDRGRDEGGAMGGTSASVGVTPRRTRLSAPEELFRAAVTGGAGILRSYDLTSDAVTSSRLSYKLAPLAMLAGEAEVIVPGLPLGVLARLAWRPVSFELKVADVPVGDDANKPKGMFLDTAALIRVHLPLGGEGRSAFRLIPAAGVRLGMLSVERHPSDLLVSHTTFSPILAVGARMPFNDVFELNLGVDGGLMLGYSESPAASGASFDGGFTLGGDLGARVWLSSAIAIAFDLRFDLEKASFTGRPTRIQAPNEELENATTTNQDLRTGIGLAFRL